MSTALIWIQSYLRPLLGQAGSFLEALEKLAHDPEISDEQRADIKEVSDALRKLRKHGDRLLQIKSG